MREELKKIIEEYRNHISQRNDVVNYVSDIDDYMNFEDFYKWLDGGL